MTTTSSFMSMFWTFAVPLVSSLRTSAVLIAASLGCGDGRVFAAPSHQGYGPTGLWSGPVPFVPGLEEDDVHLRPPLRRRAVAGPLLDDRVVVVRAVSDVEAPYRCSPRSTGRIRPDSRGSTAGWECCCSTTAGSASRRRCRRRSRRDTARSAC